MKKNILIALIAAAAIAPVAAQAESYVGASIGRGEQKWSADGDSIKDHNTAYKLFGGYQFNANVGIEGGWTDLGKFDMSDAGVTLSSHPRALYVAATGTYPLANGFALTGKIGAARTRTTLTLSGVGEGTESKTRLLLGVGGTYAITPNVQAVAEYEYFGKVFNEEGLTMKANALTVGVRFKF
jgi:OOP family OmpA-OmpF porin